MKKSIRTQFAVIFLCTFIAVLFIELFINSALLQRFYLVNKRDSLEKTYARLAELIDKENSDLNSDSFNIEFESICNTNNISVVIVDSSLKTVKSSMKDDSAVSQRLISYIFKNDPNYLFKDEDTLEYKNDELLRASNYVIHNTTDPRFGNDYLELMGVFDNGYMTLIRTSINGIKAYTRLSMRFLLYVGLFIVLVSAIIIWLVTKMITKPILQLAEISNKMAQLDFDAKYEGNDKNEIGYLGDHMNTLSSTLEKAFSELKTANNELQVDLKKREQLDTMRSEFIANVSHELKTPIAIIQGYAEGLKENVNEDPESRDYYCDVIIDESERMNKMVRNLLTLNQLEFGQDTVNMERFNISSLIKNYVHSATILLEQTNASIVIDVPDCLTVWADEFKIEEVFANYFTNAVHHVDDGGIIRITATQTDNNVRVSVFNTGKPIDSEAINHIWTKFYKVDKARTREYGGSGIGLSIVKAIMDSHHKDFGVINHPNGVEFYFELDCELDCCCKSEKKLD